MKNLKITCLPVWIVLVLVFCVSVALCGVVFYSLRQALPGGGGVASASVISAESRRGERYGSSDADINAGAFLLRWKWTPTAQGGPRSALRLLSMPLPAKPKEITQNTDEGAVATAKYAIELYKLYVFYRECR